MAWLLRGALTDKIIQCCMVLFAGIDVSCISFQWLLLSKTRVKRSFRWMFPYATLQAGLMVSADALHGEPLETRLLPGPCELSAAGPRTMNDYLLKLRRSRPGTSAIQSAYAQRHEEKWTRGVRHYTSLVPRLCCHERRIVEFFCDQCWPICIVVVLDLANVCLRQAGKAWEFFISIGKPLNECL